QRAPAAITEGVIGRVVLAVGTADHSASFRSGAWPIPLQRSAPPEQWKIVPTAPVGARSGAFAASRAFRVGGGCGNSGIDKVRPSRATPRPRGERGSHRG